jgi:hypothetical protein
MTELIGQTLGSYQVEALLGMGPAGPRYAARHARLQRLAALRLFPADPGGPEARRQLLAALRGGQAGLAVALPPRLARQAVDDRSGDSLDAVLCAVAAAGAARKGPDYGLPDFDPVEGWISG